MAKKKRSAARAAAAAVDSDEASKKAKPDVHEVSFVVVWPKDVSPQIAKLDAQQESKRAARQAKQKATSEEAYGQHDYVKFAVPSKAAVASAFTEWRRPVTVTEVINEMIRTGSAKVNEQGQLELIQQS